jgi:hypothetical protein
MTPPGIRGRLVAGLVGAVLGAGTCYLVLRAATAAWETRATRAEGTVATLRTLAAAHAARADAAAAAAATTRAGPPPPEVEIRIQTIRATVPDTAALEALEALARTLAGALADSGRALEAKDAEVRELRAALALTGAAADTAGAVLAARPGVMVAWSWRPRLQGEVFARYELPGELCAGAGPALTVWRIRATGYVGLCSTPTLTEATIEPRAGVIVTMRVF